MLITFALTEQQEGISGIKLAEALERSANSLLEKFKLAPWYPILNLNKQTSLQMKPDTIQIVTDALYVSIVMQERVRIVKRRLFGPKKYEHVRTGYGFGISVQEILCKNVYRQINMSTDAFAPDYDSGSLINPLIPGKTRKQDWENAQKLLMMFVQELQKNLQITEPQTA